MSVSEFRIPLGENVFKQKYALTQAQNWKEKARHIVEDVCGFGIANKYNAPLMSEDERDRLQGYIQEFKFLPGGRYIYYAGRPARFFNNCYLLRVEEDSREEWSSFAQRAMSCLMTGGGIGGDYSILRPRGRLLSRTGGTSSGPIPLMHAVNEIGRNVMQGGSRRSAIYASLNWQHEDVLAFLHIKDWDAQPIGKAVSVSGEPYDYKQYKEDDFNAPAALDMTNISLNYDNEFLEAIYGKPFSELLAIYREQGDRGIAALEIVALPETFIANVRQAMKNGEPGFSFNFFDKVLETLRNACTEVTSEDDSDVCNLGSVNLAACVSMEEFRDVVNLASKFLVCGTIRAELPYDKVYQVREANRRLGLGIMGVHEWLLKRGYRYEVTPELRSWLEIYKQESEKAANEHCDRFFLKRPKAYRAIAPTGTIGILAGTTTGIEPIYAVAYKRRYLTEGTKWKYEYAVDATAQALVEQGIDPDTIETAIDLAQDPERRIKFQADVQDYVDMAISSTLNLPNWGSALNNESKVKEFAGIVAKYAHRLRGLTFYPDGSRGGQPITAVPYEEAIKHKGVVFEENSVCKDGVCGL